MALSKKLKLKRTVFRNLEKPQEFLLFTKRVGYSTCTLFITALDSLARLKSKQTTLTFKL